MSNKYIHVCVCSLLSTENVLYPFYRVRDIVNGVNIV